MWEKKGTGIFQRDFTEAISMTEGRNGIHGWGGGNNLNDWGGVVYTRILGGTLRTEGSSKGVEGIVGERVEGGRSLKGDFDFTAIKKGGSQ